MSYIVILMSFQSCSSVNYIPTATDRTPPSHKNAYLATFDLTALLDWFNTMIFYNKMQKYINMECKYRRTVLRIKEYFTLPYIYTFAVSIKCAW